VNTETRAKMQELMAVAKRAFDAHLQTGTGGNISIRLNQGDRVVIKPSGIGFVECNEDNLLMVDLWENIIAGKGKPSKDMPFHLGIYKVRPDVNGIVHVHSPWATAWASSGREIPTLTIHSENKLGRIPLIPVGPEGGNQTPESIVEVYRDPMVKAALLENHGSVGVGNSLLAAEQIAELIEETAHIAAVAQTINVNSME
jgi:L-ribulose-5-phosphate 4-epimerase